LGFAVDGKQGRLIWNSSGYREIEFEFVLEGWNA